MTTADDKQRTPQARSPRYPGIPLDEALEKARVLYGQEKRNAAPAETVTRHWGYKPKSSSGLVAIAALKQFGLLDEVGGNPARLLRLSEYAVRIITDNRENSGERARLIREAALRPKLHAELWDEYRQSGLPSDSNLGYKLRWERNFTDVGIRDFIRQFRQTISFAGLEAAPEDQSSIESSEGGADDAPDPEAAGPATPIDQQAPAFSNPPTTGSMSQMLVPIAPGEYVTLSGAFPLSVAKWDQMIAVLKAMRPALVVVEPGASGPQSVRDEEVES